MYKWNIIQWDVRLSIADNEKLTLILSQFPHFSIIYSYFVCFLKIYQASQNFDWLILDMSAYFFRVIEHVNLNQGWNKCNLFEQRWAQISNYYNYGMTFF